MENSVTLLMDKEHEKIDRLLADFERKLEENLKKAEEAFSLFKWALEKHFFVEEKAVFDVYESVVGDEVSDIFDLMQEHGDIIRLVNDIEDSLYDGEKPDLSEMKSLLEKHREFEDVVFYPKLDKELDLIKKGEIINKAKEIVR